MSNNITISIMSDGRNRYHDMSPFKFTLTRHNENRDNYYTDQLMITVANGVPLTALTAGTGSAEGSGGGLGAYINFGVGTSSAIVLKGTAVSISATDDDSSNKNDYYTGCIIKVTIGTGDEESSIIEKYNGLTKECILKYPFSSEWESKLLHTIDSLFLHPSASEYANGAKALFHIPGGINKNLTGCYLHDLSVDPTLYATFEQRTKIITSYDKDTKTATLASIDGTSTFVTDTFADGVAGQVLQTDTTMVTKDKYIFSAWDSDLTYTNTPSPNGGTQGAGGNGAVATIIFVLSTGTGSHTAGSIITATGGSGSGLTIKIVSGNGLSVEIVNPGSGYKGGESVTFTTGAFTTTHRIVQIGQSVILSLSAFPLTTAHQTGTLNTTYNFYTDHIFFYIKQGIHNKANIGASGVVGGAGGSKIFAKAPRFSSGKKYSKQKIIDETGCDRIIMYSSNGDDVFIVLNSGYSTPVPTGSSYMLFEKITVKNQMLLSSSNVDKQWWEISLDSLIIPNVEYRTPRGTLSSQSHIYLRINDVTSDKVTNTPESFTFLIPISDRARRDDSKFLKLSGLNPIIALIDFNSHISIDILDRNMNTLQLNTEDTIPPHAFDADLQTCVNLSCKSVCPSDKLCTYQRNC